MDSQDIESEGLTSGDYTLERSRTKQHMALQTPAYQKNKSTFDFRRLLLGSELANSLMPNNQAYVAPTRPILFSADSAAGDDQ